MVDLDARTRKTLTLLLQAGGATTTELTRMLGRRHPQSTSATLKLLEQRGWVAKEGRNWGVTQTGREVLGPHEIRFLPAHDREAVESNRALLEALTDEPLTSSELAQLTGLERTNAHKRLVALADRGKATRVVGRPVRWRRG